ncbi:hypothetical protein SGL43_04112 [Streptomyces globisporus]|uniref:Uncharacterized protein n=1 Tax=Streptomyces globisporus TaxID=1908 RepID=A0ABM9H0E8_STRGL|nr:hypothetical protein SGL43_04112 [Streptomyces globisporus]
MPGRSRVGRPRRSPYGGSATQHELVELVELVAVVRQERRPARLSSTDDRHLDLAGVFSCVGHGDPLWWSAQDGPTDRLLSSGFAWGQEERQRLRPSEPGPQTMGVPA